VDSDDNLETFWVLFQIYDNNFTGNLFLINKQGNSIQLGSERYSSNTNKILYEM
jgi:hypothetical protein